MAELLQTPAHEGKPELRHIVPDLREHQELMAYLFDA